MIEAFQIGTTPVEIASLKVRPNFKDVVADNDPLASSCSQEVYTTFIHVQTDKCNDFEF